MIPSSQFHLACWCLLLSFQLSAQTTHYVDCSAIAGGSGTSWATAYNDLQIPLGIASAGDQIVVAKGHYSPSSSDATVSFELVDGVALLGGYLNTDLDLSQRNPAANLTVLSGHLGTNCNGVGGSGNSFSVLYSYDCSAATIVDGFTITGGAASAPCTGALRERQGGGWFNDGSGTNNISSPTIRNCHFFGNSANCGGGAIFNDGNFFGVANPSFEKCTFESNDGGTAGGAIYNNGNAGTSSPQFYQCKFIGNGVNQTPVAYGGACYNFGKNGNSNPIYISCLFQENIGYAGGAMYNLGEVGNANPQIINCTFFGNTAIANGGTIYANAGSSPNIGNADPYVANSIFFGNTAGPYLGDIFRNNNGDITVKNCLFDVAANCMELNSGIGPAAICQGSNLFGFDPLFSNSAAGDLSLSMASPAIGAGDNSEIGGSSIDVNCENRIQQGIVDLGAIESPFLPIAAPIELLSFLAKAEEGMVAIEWTTLSQFNTDFFEIERSPDGIRFTSIHQQDGEGTSNQVHVYQTLDQNPFAGYNYYRLVETDLAGNRSYSAIRVVEVSDLRVAIFPNPVIQSLNLSINHPKTSGNKGNLLYEVCNLMGQVQLNGQISLQENKTQIAIPEIADLLAGIYFIRVFDQGVKQEVLRFNKTDL